MKYCTCENEKPLKAKHITQKYTASGLDNVILAGVAHYKCPICLEEFFGYGDVEKLNKTIAKFLLLKKDLLTGNEIRFLRKHLGYNGEMFAELLGKDYASINRIENGKNPVALSFDRAVRFFVDSKTADRDYDLHDLLLNDKLNSSKRLELTHAKSGEWVLKKAA